MRTAAIVLSIIALALAGFSQYALHQHSQALKKQEAALRQYSREMAEHVRQMQSFTQGTRNEMRSLFSLSRSRDAEALPKAKARVEEAAAAGVSDPEIKASFDAAKQLTPEDVANNPEARTSIDQAKEEAEERDRKLREEARSCVGKLSDLEGELAQAEAYNETAKVEQLRASIAELERSCARVAEKIKDNDALKVFLAVLLRAAALVALAEGNPMLAAALWSAANSLEQVGGDGDDETNRNETADQGVPEPPPVINDQGDVVSSPGHVVPGTGGEYFLYIEGKILKMRGRTGDVSTLGELRSDDIRRFTQGTCRATGVDERSVQLRCLDGSSLAITFQ